VSFALRALGCGAPGIASLIPNRPAIGLWANSLSRYHVSHPVESADLPPGMPVAISAFRYRKTAHFAEGGNQALLIRLLSEQPRLVIKKLRRAVRWT
jgi:hypothetical protein